ncbi:hypothetical protein MYCTH_2296462 [Thermothelomyces thermophilus ATCC 42464]|uniref:Cx9C motif-containing protein 4, mitochondrial n=1 Tax=Thermothelomyces thermophilus (strain ATCC 42464 / BCRC 31852 / DSM 1799) TaxID=573729 RepID=G2Q1V4_THET4|nr:uncharacterized protein MYCTH_2296462 [Thermothelomyces thermophilus ATCC 42464]AEO54186.1 hypothetical protein MYCTH_2296462 [Thermothelomyces thermophilus ATCC 42464]
MRWHALCSVRFKVCHVVSLVRSPGDYTCSLSSQDCLTRNAYNEAKCARFVDALYECCQVFYERNGEKAVTASCPKPDLLRLKMEQRRKGIQ